MNAPYVPELTFSGPIAWGNSNATPQAQTGLPYFTGFCNTCCTSGQYVKGELPYTEVVPGTVTNTGCRLRTYVYYVSSLYQYVPNVCYVQATLGYYPTSPQNVQFYATVLGRPNPKVACEDKVDKINQNITQHLSNFSLDQNYPNPFNPVTEISYSIKESGHVNLRIYDILGREVAVLVNEGKEPGFYKVEFDASYLSSGIYFYSLKSGNFHQIKKMIVAK